MTVTAEMTNDAPFLGEDSECHHGSWIKQGGQRRLNSPQIAGGQQAGHSISVPREGMGVL